jgi:hypothetical protein
MDTKLTLKLKNTVIENAKYYAKSHRTSLSKIIENYFQKITEESPEANYITPLVKSLSGIIDIPGDLDHKKAYSDHLIKKYK